MSQDEALPTLTEGVWTVTADQDASLQEVLRHADELDEDGVGAGWNGLAFMTTGTAAVRRLEADVDGAIRLVSTERVHTDDGRAGEETEVDLTTVYELRLWRVPADGDSALPSAALAHELRWLNGDGSVEIVVRSAAAETMDDRAPASSGAGPCWTRPNVYLQHDSSSEPGQGPEMSALEVFEEEATFGNTVFRDELFTGRWA